MPEPYTRPRLPNTRVKSPSPHCTAQGAAEAPDTGAFYIEASPTGDILDIRDSAAYQSVLDLRRWVGANVFSLFAEHTTELGRALQGESVAFEYPLFEGAETRWLKAAFFTQDDAACPLVGICMDVTACKRASEQPLQLLEENRRLARRLIQVQEDERRRLARELHDELGQSITAVRSLATAVASRHTDSVAEIRSLGHSLIDLSGQLYDTVHNLMYQLRPNVLDNLGFEEALSACLKNSQLERNGVECNMRLAGDLEGLSELLQITAYRVIQECLTNIAKYAMATHVEVVAERKAVTIPEKRATPRRHGRPASALGSPLSRDTLVIQVLDDGIGMDTMAAKLSGLGLQGMRERVLALGGEFMLTSIEGRGVDIFVRIDVDACATAALSGLG